MRTGTAAVPDESLKAGRVRNPETVGHALRQVLARNEVSGTRALVAITDATATFRVLELPDGTTDQQVSAAVAKELALDPERFASRWTDVGSDSPGRCIYAAAWDRAAMKSVADAVKAAGLEAGVIELKSAAVARAVLQPDCIVVDLVADPAEIVLVDGGVPRQWHAVDVVGSSAQDLPQVLAAPLQSVIRFHQRGRTGNFNSHAPVFLSAEQLLPPPVLVELEDMVGHPVRVLGAPPRVPSEIRPSYLTCIGLIMRRST